MDGLMDCHLHILPGMDDGSRSEEESALMAEAIAEAGLKTVAYTPHFYAQRETLESFLSRRAAAVRAFHAKKTKYSCAAEVAFFTGIGRAEKIRELCYEGTNALLLEMPFCRWTGEDTDEVLRLKHYLGVQPVLAHVERYLSYGNKNAVRFLLDEGVKMQSNAEFFLSKRTAKTAIKMLGSGQISLLGSDAHRASGERAFRLGEAVEKIRAALGDDALTYVYGEQERILQGLITHGETE